MKIAMINTVRTQRNGITNVIFNLLGAMGEDIRVDLVSIHEPEASYYEAVAARGGQLHVVSRSIRHPARYVKQLSALIQNEGYDIVHAHGNSTTLALEMVAAKRAGCPVRIAHSHSTGCKYKALHRLLGPVFQKTCTHRLACGEAAGKWLYGERAFTVVNNGIETERFAFSPEARQTVRQALGIPAEAPVLGHTGIFNENKNQSFLLEILAAKEAPEDLELILLGDGPMRETVEEKAAELGLTERVHFVGNVADVENYLSACDLFALPSRFEGLPLSLVEAQASGLTCLASDTVTREADMTGGLCFLPLDAGAAVWARALKAALPERREASVRAVERIVARGYDIAAEAAKLKEYYRKAVEERGTKR